MERNKIKKIRKIIGILIIILSLVLIVTLILFIKKYNQIKEETVAEVLEETTEEEKINENVNVFYELNEKYNIATITLLSDYSKIVKIEYLTFLEDGTESYLEDENFVLDKNNLQATKNYTLNTEETIKVTLSSEDEIVLNLKVEEFELINLLVDTNDLSSSDNIKILIDDEGNLKIISSSDKKYETLSNEYTNILDGFIEDSQIKFYTTNSLVKILSTLTKEEQNEKVEVINTAKEEAEEQAKLEAEKTKSTSTSSTTSSSSSTLTSTSNTSGITATTYIDENGNLKNYPSYGECFARIRISSIGVNLPVYFSQDSSVLNYGVGFNTGSYLPRRRWKYNYDGT